jgi:hypothetical protein
VPDEEKEEVCNLCRAKQQFICTEMVRRGCVIIDYSDTSNYSEYETDDEDAESSAAADSPKTRRGCITPG